jgi:precorrin-6A/cobalt-precorrin-6A reductase
MGKVLILGGTGDASKLAAKAVAISGVEVITSLAGRTSQASAIAGTVRRGGFGGEVGLINYLQTQKIDLLIDATHPFASQISDRAIKAARTCNIPHLRLIRPAWKQTEGDRWIEVDSIEAAAAVLPSFAKRVFLTIGRQQLACFAHLKDIWFLFRSIDPPDPNTVLPQGLFLCDRPPFSRASEKEILLKYQIDAIVSKNSGGEATYGKIIAARELAIPVAIVRPPVMPKGERVFDVDSALGWLMEKVVRSRVARKLGDN